MTQWYYADHNRQQQGPVAAPELARLYREGRVEGTTLVWRDGLPQWEMLAAHRGELGLEAPLPPPAPVIAPAPVAAEPEPEPAPAYVAPVEPAAAGTFEWQPEPQPEPAAEPVRAFEPGPIAPAEPEAPVATAYELEPVATPAASPVEAEPLAAAPAASSWNAAEPAPASAWTVAEPAVEPEPAAAYSPYAAPAAAASPAGYYAAQAAGEVVLAGFWKRVAAYAIDSIIVGIFGALIGFVLALFAVPLTRSGDAGAAAAVALQVVIQIVSIAVTAAYYAGFHSSRGGATLGKMAIGIKVVRTDGSRISLLRGIGRYFAAMLSGLILCVGYLMAAFTERKQGLHDMLCDTLVVDKWAFTEHPEWQRRELGTLTIVILVLFGLLLVGALVMFVAMIGMIASLAG